jgi:hypothetical protein
LFLGDGAGGFNTEGVEEFLERSGAFVRMGSTSGGGRGHPSFVRASSEGGRYGCGAVVVGVKKARRRRKAAPTPSCVSGGSPSGRGHPSFVRASSEGGRYICGAVVAGVKKTRRRRKAAPRPSCFSGGSPSCGVCRSLRPSGRRCRCGSTCWESKYF